MKRITVFSFFTAALILLLASCGGSGGISGGITGTWIIAEAEGTFAEMNKGVLYEFTSGGKLTMSSGALKTEAAYTIADDMVTYTVGSVTMNMRFKLEGDTLHLEIENSDQKFTLKRQ